MNASQEPVVDLKQYIRDVPDFPKPGILFKDITPMLLEPRALVLADRGLVVPRAAAKARRGHGLGLGDRLRRRAGAPERGQIVDLGGLARVRGGHRTYSCIGSKRPNTSAAWA